MKLTTGMRALSIAAAFSLVLAATGCASGEEPGAAAPTTPAQEATGGQGVDEAIDALNDALDGPSGDERVFDTADDTVLIVVETVLASDNAKARWDGSTLRVALDSSMADVIASTPCLALESLLKEGEDAVIEYQDGDYACADRHNAG